MSDSKMNGYEKMVVHVEVVQTATSTASQGTLLAATLKMLKESKAQLWSGTKLSGADLEEFPTLARNVTCVSIEERGGRRLVSPDDVCRVHVYRLDRCGPGTDQMHDANEEGEEIPAATRWNLPSEEFFGAWESLVFDDDIKDELLDAVETSLLFSERGVDPNTISLNRTVLLHGPPGTGKTTLCKALAQKLSIRLADRYADAQLVEINSHSLFSKWFSESGKLVMRLFNTIEQIAENGNTLVCVLIDEVESLAHTRKAALSGVEPSDSLRAVNAMLTQLDRIKRKPNVIVLTTSNVTAAIDLAFVDRADIKRFVDHPSEKAVYEIYRSCIDELIRAGIVVHSEPLLHYATLQMHKFEFSQITSDSLLIWELATLSKGLSGRTLRKIPYLAFIQLVSARYSVDLKVFMRAMKSAVSKHQTDMDSFVNSVSNIKI